MLNKTKKIYKNVQNYYLNILKTKNDFKINPLTSLRMKLKGFTPNQYVLYNLKENNIENYISEFERWKTRETNSYYRYALDDKLLFQEIFHKYMDIPKNLFWINNDRVLTVKGKEITSNELIKMIRQNKAIFVKPVRGGGGRSVFKVSYDQEFYLNQEPIEFKKLLEYLKKQNNFIGTAAIIQHDYSHRIYPNSVNTIRVITTYNSNTNRIEIPDALHRFGSSSTGPVDNASKGGLFAQIDIDRGILTEAKNYSNDTYVIHPDSKVKIKGQEIPRWEELKKMCLDIAGDFPYIPYMAWDIVITKEGFEVIEINASTDLTLLQMWEGKRNSELGSFLKVQGIIK